MIVIIVSNFIIGRGEYATFAHLAVLFPNIKMEIQVPLSKLLSKDWVDDFSVIQKKETLDIVVYTDPIIVVRVQDPHHNGRITAGRDVVQRKTLEWNDVKVVDVFHYDCEELMKDIINKKSMEELLFALKQESIF